MSKSKVGGSVLGPFSPVLAKILLNLFSEIFPPLIADEIPDPSPQRDGKLSPSSLLSLLAGLIIKLT